MRTETKICGIKSLKEIKFINKMDIDYIGFVFAKSKRQIDAAQAAILSAALREDIQTVGVFVDHSVEDINSIAEQANLDIIQVHKNYDREMIAKITKPVWYALSVVDRSSIDEANEAYTYENVVGIVTDSYVKGMEGGTGVTFNWDLLLGLNPKINLILAGGLNPHNIDVAIQTVKPNIVDISSGVEKENNGVTGKSKAKIKELLRKAKI